MMGQVGRQMDRQTADRNIYEYGCVYMNERLGASPHQAACLPARVCFVHVHINVRALHFFLTGDVWPLTISLRPSPHNPNTHTPHLTSLYPGQLSAGTWPKKKTHLSPSFKGQGSERSVSVCAEREGGGRLLFTRLISAVVLSRALWHTSEGYGCFKCRQPLRPCLVFVCVCSVCIYSLACLKVRVPLCVWAVLERIQHFAYLSF